MPREIITIIDLIEELEDLLRITQRCAPVLFEEHFRAVALPAIDEALEEFPRLRDADQLRNADEYGEMRNAGLTGRQLEMKLKSFEASARDFEVHGTKEHLEDVLDKGSVVLGSLAGAIPGIGSFAQELVDYLLKELRKKWRITWPWKRNQNEQAEAVNV